MIKNIVITGSSRGIGYEMALKFLESGCNVTLSGRKETLPVDKSDILEKYKNKYIYVQCDVLVKANLEKLWDVSAARWGEIDVWINNAGRNAPNSFIWETDESHTADIIRTNITGMILGSQVAAKRMIDQDKGYIYSMEGLGSNNMIQKKTVLYGTTKCALTYFMKGLAKELEDSPVNAGRLSPGMMLTDFITKNSDGSPSEVVTNEQFRKVFNILADKPDRVAVFLVRKILTNKKNGVHIMWLTNTKAAWRFMTAPLRKRKLI